MLHRPPVRDEIKYLRSFANSCSDRITNSIRDVADLRAACLKIENRIDDLEWSIKKAGMVRSYDRWALAFIAAAMLLMGWYSA